MAVVGSRVYVANVGDSSALLCSSHPCMSSQANLTHLLDSAFTPSSDYSAARQRNGDSLMDHSGVSSGSIVHNGLNESENNSSSSSSSSIVTDIIKNKSKMELLVRNTIGSKYSRPLYLMNTCMYVCTYRRRACRPAGPVATILAMIAMVRVTYSHTYIHTYIHTYRALLDTISP